jgi:hypothetical protein
MMMVDGYGGICDAIFEIRCREQCDVVAIMCAFMK